MSNIVEFYHPESAGAVMLNVAIAIADSGLASDVRASEEWSALLVTCDAVQSVHDLAPPAMRDAAWAVLGVVTEMQLAELAEC